MSSTALLLMTRYLRAPLLIQVPTGAWFRGSWNITLFLPPSEVTLPTLAYSLIQEWKTRTWVWLRSGQSGANSSVR